MKVHIKSLAVVPSTYIHIEDGDYIGFQIMNHSFLNINCIFCVMCKRLLQHHSSKASILWHSAFFMVQLSYPYMITGKTIALTRWTFVSKVTSLIFFCLFSTPTAPSKHILLKAPVTIQSMQSPLGLMLAFCFPRDRSVPEKASQRKLGGVPSGCRGL